jgi:RimJ/RimL family protein N-acetyltransferase
MTSVIATGRLDLRVVEKREIELFLRGERPVYVYDPYDFLTEHADIARVRLATLEADPASLPWLMRAIVLREETRAIGLINFHAPPDEHGAVEIGYEIAEPYRRRGFAREAATALIDWAAANGARLVRARIDVGNVASQATLVGFTFIREQIDEVDGPEYVYERTLVGGC